MRHWQGRITRLIQDETAVTSIEYALLGALIAVAIAGAVGALGNTVQQMYGDVQTKVSQALN